MNDVFFTADLHLGHNNIIKHCYRPFKTVEEMDSTIIDNINMNVDRSDRLYILGDFSVDTFYHTKLYRERIQCPNVYLILGNHDRLSVPKYEEAGFIVKGYMADIKVEDQPITLCHYAMRRWNKSHRGAWQLYGHSHGHLPDDPTLFSFDVGVDCHYFEPLSFGTVKAIMALRPHAVIEPNHPLDLD